MGNLSFDTCVYHQPGIDLLFAVIDTDRILFGSEMIGAVRGIDPRTGHHFDDTRRYIDALGLSPEVRAQVDELNARRIYPRLGAAGGPPGLSPGRSGGRGRLLRGRPRPSRPRPA
jgi:4-oxalmesaconate hydratase